MLFRSELDAAGVTVIVARTTTPVTYLPGGGGPIPGGTGLARAVDDRLIRAAGSRVVSTAAQRQTDEH